MIEKLKRIARRFGCDVRQTRTSYQVFTKESGTVFQDHRADKIIEYLNTVGYGWKTSGSLYMETDSHPCAVKYVRLTTRP